jgi:hypothetical protein
VVAGGGAATLLRARDARAADFFALGAGAASRVDEVDFADLERTFFALAVVDAASFDGVFAADVVFCFVMGSPSRRLTVDRTWRSRF